ncbi:MAG: UDP-N-acetylmuramate--L-alanine ligase [Bacteriovoracia bacterium]
MYKKVKDPIHFIGIGGIGMSGIAQVLAAQGYPVSGSDLVESDTVKKLRNLGIRVSIGHKAENLANAKIVVVSSAVKKDNHEIVEAKRLEIPIVARAEMLAEIMRLKFGIAVAGTHGKTTTTSMLATILFGAQEDPTIIVGGKVDALGGNAKLGKGKFLVAEADESDGSFLSLSPVVTIITNIDNDHLDFYGQMEKLRSAFVNFANKVPYYGRSIVCIDDIETAKIIPMLSKPLWTYGFSEDAQFQITDFKVTNTGSKFSLKRDGAALGEVRLQVPGKHNARNAVAAIAAALEIDLSFEQAVAALENFSGVRRRFEKKGHHASGALVIDDYGHHPTEIEATLSAAKSFSKGRVIAVFQPHRFSRTQLCWDSFAKAFELADTVVLADIYPAGEAPIDGIDSSHLAQHIAQNHKDCRYAGKLSEIPSQVSNLLSKDDLLVLLGAGNITQLSGEFVS